MATSAADVQFQLERILASQVLAGSDQLKRLLRTVVERTLNGQSDSLKEYNLGLDVFQRSADYDPKSDPIVRVQARRLRSKLGEDYAAEGVGDPVLIEIPKGAYVPAFQARSQTHPTPGRRLWLATAIAVIVLAAILLAWSSRPGVTVSANINRSVAVLPLQNYAENGNPSHVADQFTEILTTAMARNPQLRVLSHTTALQYRDVHLSLPEIARQLRVRWIVEGGVGMERDRAYIKLRAVDADTDRKIWADVIDVNVSEIVPAGTRAAGAVGSAIEDHLRSIQQ